MPGVKARAAHSIWFETLGEHGFVVFGIWLGILVAGGLYTLRIARRTRDRPELRWAYDLARMSQVAMVAYMAGGSFLSLAYWDCFWTLIVALAAVDRMVRQPAAQEAGTAVPARTGGWRMRTAAAPIATARGSALRP
jgi:hypothetical protein